MGVVGRVFRAGDHHDRAVGEAIVERRRGDAELAAAVAAQDLQHGLLDGAQPVEPGLLAGFHGDFAGDRPGRGHPSRPDRIGAVAVQVLGAHAHDTRHKGLKERLVVPGGGERSELAWQRRVPVVLAGRGRGAFVRDHAPDVRRHQRRAEGAAATVGVAEDVDRASTSRAMAVAIAARSSNSRSMA